MRLSIVVPVLNDAPALGRLLRALAPARVRGAEVIVVDGGSRDGARDVAVGQVDRYLQTAPGRAVQMNAGAGVAQGQALWFVHADCVPPSDADQGVCRALFDDGHVWGRFDVRLEGRSRWLPLIATLMNVRSRWTGIATGDQGLFVRREVFEQVGGFEPLPLMEDIALSRTLRRIGRPACLRLRMATSGRRWDRDGAWRTIVLMWSLRLRYWLGASPEALHARYYGTRASDAGQAAPRETH